MFYINDIRLVSTFIHKTFENKALSFYVNSFSINTFKDNMNWLSCSTSNSCSTFVSVFTIKRPKVASKANAHDFLKMKIRIKCILSTLAFNLFLDIQRKTILHSTISIHRYICCLHEIAIQIFIKTSWSKEKFRH